MVSTGRHNAILKEGERCHETKNGHLYTPKQKAIIRDRYYQGDSLLDIAKMFDRHHSSIMPTIHQTGGYRPPSKATEKPSTNISPNLTSSKSRPPNAIEHPRQVGRVKSKILLYVWQCDDYNQQVHCEVALRRENHH